MLLKAPGRENAGAAAGAAAGTLGLLCAVVAFCRAMLARAFMIDGMSAEAGAPAAGCLPWVEAILFAGGLPGGVVEAAGGGGETLDRTVEEMDVTDGGVIDDILGGALSFSLKDASKLGGNVWPFSQMSTSFLIFSYM